MPATDEAIRQLYSIREKHRYRIEQIDAALALLGQTVELDELVQAGLPGPPDLRDIVLAVLADSPDHATDLGTIYTAAIDRGWRSSSENPRNAFASAVSRLALAGDVEKVERGRYRLPAPQRELISA